MTGIVPPKELRNLDVESRYLGGSRICRGVAEHLGDVADVAEVRGQMKKKALKVSSEHRRIA
jgi:hypothetical protein